MKHIRKAAPLVGGLLLGLAGFVAGAAVMSAPPALEVRFETTTTTEAPAPPSGGVSGQAETPPVEVVWMGNGQVVNGEFVLGGTRLVQIPQGTRSNLVANPAADYSGRLRFGLYCVCHAGSEPTARVELHPSAGMITTAVLQRQGWSWTGGHWEKNLTGGWHRQGKGRWLEVLNTTDFTPAGATLRLVANI